MTANVSSISHVSSEINKNKQPTAVPPIPHITNNYISLQATIANLILFTHKELRNILETLPATSSDFAKKRRLLDFIVKIRVQFVKVYVLTKWARVSKDISKTIDVVAWLNGQQNCFNNLVSALFNIEKQLAGAKLRTPDIETALQVLTAGRPFQSSRNFFPQKKLAPSTILQTLHDLDILLSIRLALTEKLPPEFSHYKISDGRVTFFIDNSYQVQLGIADDSVKARFFFVDFKFDFPGAFSPSPRTKHRLEMESNEILAKKGLISFFEMLFKFTQNYKLSTYYTQIIELQRGLYSEILVPRFQPDKSLVTIHYWPHYKVSSSYKNTISIGISKAKKIGVIWIRDNQVVANHGIEFGQTNNSVENLIQQFTTLHVRHLILSVFNSLSRILDHNPRSNSTAPSLSRPVKSIAAQRAIYLQVPNRNGDSAANTPAAVSPQSPSTQASSTPNTPASSDGQQRDGNNEFYGSDQSNQEIINMISPEKIKIRLTGTRFTVFSIDKLTGKPILTNSTNLISSVESAISEAQGRSSAIADLLIKLRLASIQEDICNRAKAAGWIAKPNILIHSSVVRSKFPSDTRSIFCLRQPSWPERWFLLVTLNTHGLPHWWITQMFMKDGTWNIIFTEEISTPQEEYDGNYSYATLNELSVSTFARIRTEALRKELDRCKIRYRLVSNDSAPLPFPSTNNEKDNLPIAMLDVNSISDASSWAESSIFMRIDRYNESDDTVKVLIQGRTKNTLAIEAMPSKDPDIQFHPKSSVFYLTLSVKSNAIPFSMAVAGLGDNSSHSSSELVSKVAAKFLQIENIVNHISLLRALSLNIVSASMEKITFEYGPSMTASISLADTNEPSKPVVKPKDQVGKAIKPGFQGAILELDKNSPHMIVAPLLQEMINIDGLLAVVWVLRKSLPLYLALQEITKKHSDTNVVIKKEGSNNPTNGKTGDAASGNKESNDAPVIVNIHGLTDFVIHFLGPSTSNGGEPQNPGRVCIKLKLMNTNGRPLSIFVSEYFPRLASQNPKITGPIFKSTNNKGNGAQSAANSPEIGKAALANGSSPSAKKMASSSTGSLEISKNGVGYQPLVPLWTKFLPDVPSSIPLQQGLSCHMNDIQLVMRKIHARILNPSAEIFPAESEPIQQPFDSAFSEKLQNAENGDDKNTTAVKSQTSPVVGSARIGGGLNGGISTHNEGIQVNEASLDGTRSTQVVL